MSIRQRLTSLLPFIVGVAPLAGCADDALVAETAQAQEAWKSDLELIGFRCETVSHNTSLCTKCRPDGSCLTYQCVGGDCYSCGWVGEPPCVGLRELGQQFHFFEAEAGAVTAPMAKVTTLAASGASAGGGVVRHSGTLGAGSASYAFTVATAGGFQVWARVRTASTAADTIGVRFDAGATTTWQLPVTGAAWRWVQLTSGGAPVTKSLTAGAHTLRLIGAEAGAYVDRLLITDDPGFVPVTETFEAESGGVLAPMVKGSTGLLGTGFVWVPNGAGPGGSTQFAAPVPVDGSYIVWGRGSAPSTSDDAFMVSATFSTPTLWELPVTTATGWAWSRANAPGSTAPQLMWLPATNGFLQLDRADDGARLDKVVVTNDPGHTPVEPAAIVNQ